jgi:hypothetical protein
MACKSFSVHLVAVVVEDDGSEVVVDGASDLVRQNNAADTY